MESNDILDSDYQNENDSTNAITIDLVSSNKFILFYIFSFGLYSAWWMYKMWKFYEEKEGLNIMPAARAIFGIFFLFRLFEKIKIFAIKQGYDIEFSSEGLYGAFLVTIFSGYLPDPYWLISFLGLLCFIQPINAFNFGVLHSNMFNGRFNSGFSARQIVLLLIGGMFWFLIIIGLLLPEPIQ